MKYAHHVSGQKRRFERHQGFTLIEILLAIGILAILATAAVIAINPGRQFAEARNSQRWSDVNALMNAVYQYSVGHKGALPDGIPGGDNLTEICFTGGTCSGIVDLTVLTDSAKYLTAIPIDPSCPAQCSTYGTGYIIATNDDGRVHIQADNAELGETIELSR